MNLKPSTFDILAFALSVALIYSVAFAGRHVAPSTLQIIAERAAHP